MIISLNQKVLAFFQGKENYKDLLAFCSYLIKDLQKAEDVTQETFLRMVLKEENGISKIKFPEDALDFKNYVKTTAKRIYLGSLRSSKGLTSGSENDMKDLENEIVYEKNYNAMQKLDNLNTLILKNKKLFTESQLQLWHCMYECKPIEEIVRLMGKNTQTVYSLKNKLKAKIRIYFSLEMISN